MPVYRQNITGLGDPATPAPDALSGLRPLSRAAWESAMRAQDFVVPTGRRIVATWQAGASATGWRFGPVAGIPAQGVILGLGLARACLSPGTMLRAAVRFLPSGGYGVNPAEPLGGQGSIQLQCAWEAADGTTDNSTHTVVLPPSTEDDFGISGDPGGAWGGLRVVDFAVQPGVDLTDAEQLQVWSEPGAEVEIESFLITSPRVLEVVVYEVPIGVAYDEAEDARPSHVFATGTPDATSGAASNRPRTRRSAVNPRGGTERTLDVAQAQRAYLGPLLAHWGSYQEDNATPTQGLTPLTVTGSAAGLVNAFDASITEYDELAPGLTVACGGHARDWRGNNPQAMGADDEAASVKVLLRVYGSVDTGTVRVRLHTEDYSWVEVELTTALGWREGIGWLRVGVNGSDPVTAQVLVDGAGDVDLWAIELERCEPGGAGGPGGLPIGGGGGLAGGGGGP